MGQSQVRLFAVIACAVALLGGCASSMEPRSGSQTDQQRNSDNEPSGMKSGGGGGGY